MQGHLIRGAFLVVLAGSGTLGWNYEDPSAWCDEYALCCGDQQSPIDLDSGLAEVAVFPDFSFSQEYFSVIEGVFENMGETVQFSASASNVTHPATVSGGPLAPDVFQFVQFHFHWEAVDNAGGSDHTIDGQRYSGELHLVHRNVKYATQEEALEQPDGLAVLGIMLQSDRDAISESIEPLHIALDDLSVAHSTVDMTFSLSAFLADLVDLGAYFSYAGSLTTPGCNEAVTWVNFVNPLVVQRHQLYSFRHLHTDDDQEMGNNFRPTQAIGSRTVFLSLGQQYGQS